MKTRRVKKPRKPAKQRSKRGSNSDSKGVDVPKNEIDEKADIVRCSSEEDFYFVLDFVCDNGIARQVLGEVSGYYYLAVPKGSADDLMKSRPAVEIESALSAAELDAEERAELRRNNLAFVDSEEKGQ